jgi:hypothetical protein
MRVEPSNLVKVVAAFVGGVVVALGSALIYVRVSDMVHTRPVTEAVLPPSHIAIPDATPPPPPPDISTPEPSDQEVKPIHVTRHRNAAAAPLRKVDSKKVKPVGSVKLSSSRIDTSQYEANDTSTAPANYPPLNLPNTAPAPVVADVSSNPAGPPLPEQQPQSEATSSRQPHIVTLPAGTNLAIRLGETLSTDHNYTGDTFRGTLDADIVMDGFVIADKGSKVLGKIVNAERAGRIGGMADLTIALTEINTTDNQRVRIETGAIEKKGPSNNGQDAAKIAGGAALGAIIGAIAGGGKGAAIGAGAGGAAGTGAVLITHGRPAVFPTETRLNFRLANPVTITERLNN